MNQICDRCQEPTNTLIMSMFNTEMICPKCKKREKQSPMYEQAVAADIAQIKKGNYNFPGIGLPDDLKNAAHADSE